MGRKCPHQKYIRGGGQFQRFEMLGSSFISVPLQPDFDKKMELSGSLVTAILKSIGRRPPTGRV